jgi:hypothetical protein
LKTRWNESATPEFVQNSLNDGKLIGIIIIGATVSEGTVLILITSNAGRLQCAAVKLCGHET